jgi:hypothetical protein
MNRGRFQAQGNNLEKSEPWATLNDINKIAGNQLINSLQNQLTNREYTDRVNALNKARRFVDISPINGHTVIGLKNISKTFSNTPQNRSIRIDLEIEAGIAFQD